MLNKTMLRLEAMADRLDEMRRDQRAIVRRMVELRRAISDAIDAEEAAEKARLVACDHCGLAFVPVRSSHRHCSRKCAGASYRAKKSPASTGQEEPNRGGRISQVYHEPLAAQDR